MKTVGKQKNSKMCFICGLDNEFGVRAQFHNMADGSVATLFKYDARHQSFPGRVHGGLIASMIDELGLRGLWSYEGGEDNFGVTMRLETQFRKPVPYGEQLLGVGKIVKRMSRFFVVESKIYDLNGETLASGSTNYIRLDVGKIAEGTSVHDEMCYLIEDDVTDIDIPE